MAGLCVATLDAAARFTILSPSAVAIKLNSADKELACPSERYEFLS
jgi:hypothetical protein